MSHLLFILILFFFYLFQIVFSLLSILLSSFIPKLKKRLSFERLNLVKESSRSFKTIQLKADCCFEVSSEGELEQVYPLVEELLVRNKLIEVIYSSESVENKCQKLFEKYPTQVRLLRLPLLSGHFFSFLSFQDVGSWISASKIVFCRYDFFPSLLILKFFGHQLFLVSGCMKNVGWFKRHVFSLFDYIVAANTKERELFINEIGLNDQIVLACDFRIPRIFRRVGQRHIVFDDRPLLLPLINYFKEKESNEKLIIGSMWPSDSRLFFSDQLKQDLLDKKLSILILPHKIDDHSIRELIFSISEALGDLKIPIRVIKAQGHNCDGQSSSFEGLSVLVESGVLVELYTFFDIAYVGGGFERSIHSVLEPFMANSLVICGAKTHRSTEFDFILSHSPHEIHILKNPESFYNVYKTSSMQLLSLDQRQKSRSAFYKDSLKNMEFFIQILEAKVI